MSYMRVQRRQLNRSVQYDNRLATFTAPPVQTGDLYVTGNLSVAKELHATNYHASGNYYLHGHVLIPAGTVIQSAAINVPGGWLPCDGKQYLVNDYPDLFSAIEYTYGGNEEDGVFAVPDMQGRVAVGTVNGEETSYTLAATGGEEMHELSVDEMPAHSHTSNAIGGTIGLITSDKSDTPANVDQTGDNEPNLYNSLPALIINNTGGGQAHNNMQPYLVLRYLIKA